ncbi:RNA recognition motif family protein [Aspergillus niger]|uniref:RNA recognition motif family protein n=1 Tax=Aspergillus niger TaxID=5061 RepID=A0A505IDR9_ASPNG|nr:RNA recognition motif family protein [Aspergillus niger]
MATTPPPPSTLRIPPTPRLGAKYDDYEPYSTRYSARLASQRAARDRESRTTPPPSFPSSKTANKYDMNESDTLSPPGSVQTSPRKLKSARATGLFATHSLEGPSGTNDSDPFGAGPSSLRHQSRSLRPTMTEGMLPTPAKTPRKKAVADVGNTARVLFPPPSARKKTKKHTGFSLDSFCEDDTQGGSEIQIYTDSRDRIPEVDKSEDNPFYNKPTASNTTTRASRRKETRRDKEIDDSLNLEARKCFANLIDSSIDTVRPLTRSSIKPRVLFPTARSQTPQESRSSDVDEEAATDIEDHLLHDEVEEDENPTVDVEMQQRPVTPPPQSTVATPPSPGATMRSLRSRSKRDGPEHSETPTASETKKKRVSPFDGWLRKKTAPALTGTKAKKRDAEAAGSPGGPAPKKTRGNKATAS